MYIYIYIVNVSITCYSLIYNISTGPERERTMVCYEQKTGKAVLMSLLLVLCLCVSCYVSSEQIQ